MNLMFSLSIGKYTSKQQKNLFKIFSWMFMLHPYFSEISQPRPESCKIYGWPLAIANFFSKIHLDFHISAAQIYNCVTSSFVKQNISEFDKTATILCLIIIYITGEIKANILYLPYVLIGLQTVFYNWTFFSSK